MGALSRVGDWRHDPERNLTAYLGPWCYKWVTVNQIGVTDCNGSRRSCCLYSNAMIDDVDILSR